MFFLSHTSWCNKKRAHFYSQHNIRQKFGAANTDEQDMDVNCLVQKSSCRCFMVQGKTRATGDPRPDEEVRVLVINTGGTIGMIPQKGGLVPEENALVKNIRKIPILHDEEYAQKTKLYDYYQPADKTLVLPLSNEKKRVVYTFLEYSPLLDSSNMTPDDWITVANDIEKHYEKYEGVVVLHGTDTMAYTVSALSFMCENLGKPVIFTGSQVPIFELQSDGRDNLVGALLFAGQFVIPEVCLYFDHKLYRGNRVTKVDAGGFAAFTSPNMSPLASNEMEIKIEWESVLRPTKPGRFTVHTGMNQHVAVLRLFPGITTDTVKAFLQSPMKGVVLQTYGTGNAPDNRPDLLHEIQNATHNDIIIVNCTQCLRGSVSPIYATGQALGRVGVIAGGDMTCEAALTKLSSVLAKQDLSTEEKKKMMGKSLRGEMEVPLHGTEVSLDDTYFIQLLARSLNLGCKKELEDLRDALMPTLACAAAKNGDTDALKTIHETGTDLSKPDYDGRTPLHVAVSEGKLEAVKYLLEKGATVSAKDRFGDTPLANAVYFRRQEIVTLLKERGAQLSEHKLKVVGTELTRLAAAGDVEGLQLFKLAGVSMTEKGFDGQTPLQVAESRGLTEVITFLKT